MYHRNPDDLTDTTDFVKDLHSKSANMIELIALLEDAFHIEIPFAEVVTNSTVGAATAYVAKKVKQSGQQQLELKV